jgi:hypothetical protein
VRRGTGFQPATTLLKPGQLQLTHGKDVSLTCPEQLKKVRLVTLLLLLLLLLKE